MDDNWNDNGAVNVDGYGYGTGGDDDEDCDVNSHVLGW